MDNSGVSVNRKGAFSVSDFFRCLYQAWAGLNLAVFLLYSGRAVLPSKGAVGGSALLLQFSLFAVFFLLALAFKLLKPKVDSDVFSIFLTELWILGLSITYADFALATGLAVLGLVLLWAIRSVFASSASFARRLGGFSSAFIAVCLIASAVLAGFKQFTEVSELSAGSVDASLSQKYFFLFSDEAWILLITVTFSLVVFAVRLTLEYAELKQKFQKLDDHLSHLKITAAILFTAMSCAALIFFLGRILLARVGGLLTPTEDLGIFHQIFQYMRRTGLPLSTLEADGLYSHFKITFSPILYLYLPFFMISPKPETLQLIQTLVMAFAVIPLFRLCRRFGLSALETAGFGAVYLLSPALLISSLKDFNESCILPLLLFCFFLSVMYRRTAGILISALLILCVRQDTALYLLAGVFFMLAESRRALIVRQSGEILEEEAYKKQIRGNRLAAALVAVLSLAAAVPVLTWMSLYGKGMGIAAGTDLLQYKGALLPSLFRSLFQNPSYYFSVVFTPAKLHDLIMAGLSLGFLPFLQKRKSAYFLFIPLVWFELLRETPHTQGISQVHDAGSYACLIFAALLAYSGFVKPHQGKWKPALASGLLALAILSSTAFSAMLVERNNAYVDNYVKFLPRSGQMLYVLDRLPRDKVIACGNLLTTPLGNCAQLYDYTRHDSIRYGRDIDLLVIDLRNSDDWSDSVMEWYMDHGYTYSDQYSSEWIAVFERSDASPKAPGKSSSKD